MPPRPSNISQQERRLEQAQRLLERARKQEKQARKLVGQEMQKLKALRKGQEGILSATPTVTPDTSAAPAGFESQFDQFGNTLSGERLSTEPADSPFKNVDSYRFWDRDTHFTTISQDPGVTVYVSGIYVASEHGNHTIASKKEYEYILPPSEFEASPVSVGDTLTVPVNRRVINGGREHKAGHLTLEVTDIYTKLKFHPYHERTDG